MSQPTTLARTADGQQRRFRIVAGVVALVTLVPAGIVWFVISLSVYGLYTWSEPKLSSDLWLMIPLLAVILSLGPAVMILGRTRRRWIWLTISVFVAVVALASLATWIPLVINS